MIILSPIYWFEDIFLLHQKLGGWGPLKSGCKTQFFHKGHWYLCVVDCCTKDKRVKTNDKNKKET